MKGNNYWLPFATKGTKIIFKKPRALFQGKIQNIFLKLSKLRVIPVVATQKTEDAGPLANVLIAGGFACAEIAFRIAKANLIEKEDFGEIERIPREALKLVKRSLLRSQLE
ncbi:MAG: hypothetical protein JSU83_03540 [Deltaproteobacteria bacterium]|nr:MAG: hypothetical protein JSU83_03540 [Deltaproteobacteria bacterium]